MTLDARRIEGHSENRYAPWMGSRFRTRSLPSASLPSVSLPGALLVGALLVGLVVVGSAACARDENHAPPQPSASAAAPRARPIEVVVGKPPPDFRLPAHDGSEVQLSSLKGLPVVLFFYPKDESPDCTKEASGFRDTWKELSGKGVVVIGISGDSDASHRKFAEHHKLPFFLVSDPDGQIASMFGVPYYDGHARRQTILIDDQGIVRKIYGIIDVTTHARDVIADLSQLRGGAPADSLR
jgi:thioredoxin-dependent peroxiredoxin